MINKSLNDATQRALIPHIQHTQELLERVVSELNAGNGGAEITIMPDFGISSNPIRMNGGFFTGMFIHWESQVPFIPVDTTVNGCGVSVYLLHDIMPNEEFFKRTKYAEKYFSEFSFNWNFERGNHFISYGITDSGEPCAVFHASADEFKHSIENHSLYPEKNVWYADDIKTIRSDNGRYLRYISGVSAEKFCTSAANLSQINERRMDLAAELVFGNCLKEKLLYISHYGMPDDHSVAIGCSWHKGTYVLLTALGKDIYLVNPDLKSIASKYVLNPHGFGVELASPCDISYQRHGELHLNGISISDKTQILATNLQCVRGSSFNDGHIREHIDRILKLCPGTISKIIHQRASVSSAGALEFQGNTTNEKQEIHL